MSAWNRLRYTVWAPVYDTVAGAAGFDRARRTSIERLHLQNGDRVLIVGAGTGLDLPYLPPGVDVTACDVTPAMLKRLDARARTLGRTVASHVMDARTLAFADASFDAVVMHLILAVMPEPERGLGEAARVVRPGRRIAVFDKFAPDGEGVSWRRTLVNVLAKPLFSDLNRRFGPMLAGTALTIEHHDAVAFGGMYQIVTLRRPRPLPRGRASQELAIR